MYWSSVPEFYQDLLYSFHYYFKRKRIFISPAGNQVITWFCWFCCSCFTDVLILMVWVYSKLNITKNWYLRFEHKKFADIRKLCSYLGKELSLNLQKIKFLTGYNTTCYFYWVEKVYKIARSTRFIPSIVRVRKLLSNYQQCYWGYQWIH